MPLRPLAAACTIDPEMVFPCSENQSRGVQNETAVPVPAG
jgi:hypothetical protein